MKVRRLKKLWAKKPRGRFCPLIKAECQRRHCVNFVKHISVFKGISLPPEVVDYCYRCELYKVILFGSRDYFDYGVGEPEE